MTWRSIERAEYEMSSTVYIVTVRSTGNAKVMRFLLSLSTRLTVPSLVQLCFLLNMAENYTSKSSQGVTPLEKGARMQRRGTETSSRGTDVHMHS